MLDFKILLIGEGMLASKLVEHSKTRGIRFKTISSSAITGKSGKVLTDANAVDETQSNLRDEMLPSRSLLSFTSFLR